MEKDNLFPKIMSEQFPYDMGPWITEKSENGIKALIEIAKLLPEINNSKDISDDTKQWLHASLSEAMDKINVLYAFSCGINTGPGNTNLLLEKHEKGFKEVKVKYGLLETITEQINIENLEAFYEILNEYLQNEFPLDIDCMNNDTKFEIFGLSKELEKDLNKYSFRKETNYKTTGKVIYDEFYPKKSKPIIDETDKVLAKYYGFSEEEQDFIINYDIKYRMGSELEGEE